MEWLLLAFMSIIGYAYYKENQRIRKESAK